MTRRLLLPLFLLALLGAAAAWVLAPDAPPPRPAPLSALQPPERLPDLTLTTVSGEPIPLPDLHGRPVLIQFWATTCRTCLAEMPHLADLYRRQPPGGLAFIAIAMPYDRPLDVKRMAERQDWPFPVALDPMASATQRFGGVQLTPTSLLYDGRGRLQESWIGAIDFKALRRLIHAMETA